MQKATTKTLYYEHSAANPVTLTVKPGEWFEVETQMNRGPDAALVPDEIRELYNQYRSDSQPTDRGNAASGCIYVDGAKPGDLLTVHIKEIKVHPVGWTRYGGSTGAMPGYLGPSNIGPQFRICRIENDEIIWNDRLRFPVEPMLGVVGVAPEREARHNGWAGEWGGNFDIQEVTNGARLSIPIHHEGALLHIGDMHARQGDGEICGGGGIETGGTVTMKVELSEKPAEMTWPRIENDEYIMTTACEKPAEDAFRIALTEMILWLEASYGMSRGEAYMFLSQCLEARVTQFVNPSYSYVAKVARKYLV
ncbi:MAG: acetamidase/formamidase family protein [Chloroflexi bacterium]|nr:acetamidase/formamidase family protein [Chloroflexota bacterium]MCI0809872.1 acetamidase/formamidase family protein [Chloroflexota bacterium]MCI0834914.1 acetamidase/formamidase family protein [Chloroflexota bacterium]MCI0852065.1 acetamidase/formamidase family protein [Chloroflexota bacterium]MCI0871757.1 acetamidase/formamidase family protein [Chloroflexota bacterium]